MLIDLDVPAEPAATRSSRRNSWWRAAAAAAVLLLLPGAAATPSPPVTFPRVADTGDRLVVAALLTPQALYAVHTGTGEYGVDIVARPLAPGGPAWRVPAALPADETLQLSRSGPVLVVRSKSTVKILDAATGRDRWDAGGDTGMVTGDRVLLQRYDATGALRFADLATGRIRWTGQDHVAAAELYASGRYLFTLDFDGNARVRSATDGRVLASRRVDELIDPAFRLIGDRAYVMGEVSVTALHLPDLSPVWSLPARAPRVSSITACGDLLCATGNLGTVALDPATGASRWGTSQWLAYHPGDVAQSRDGHIVVLDPATGRVIRGLGRGVVTGGLLLRAAGEDTQVSDLRTGRLYGTLPGVLPYGCVAAEPFLACPRSSGRVVFRAGS